LPLSPTEETTFVTDNTPADSADPKSTPVPKATSAAKAPAAKVPVKAPVAVKTSPAKKAPAAAKATTTVPAVEPAPSTSAPAAVAMAPAGWYPVAAGSPQQRWWDGARWTEHVYGPTTATAQPAAGQAATGAQPDVASAAVLRAPEGVKPGTVWFWLLAVGAPVLTILDLIPTSIYLSQLIGGDTTDPASLAANSFSPAYLLTFLSSWFIYAVCVVFGLLDWRELKARGVPKPFHWAWSFFVIIVGWPAVYVIGRTVVAKRRTGAGMAPLWVFIGLEVVAFVVSLIVVISALIELLSVFGDALSAAGNVL
jgi:Protein of unknown function (DUF2510)